MWKRLLPPAVMMISVCAFAQRHFSTTDVPVIIDPDHQGTEALFYEKLDGNMVQCGLCFRNCVIPQGQRGYCRVRENREGVLNTLVYGRPSSIQIDPVEKEPQHHFLPGTEILCLGTAGCNFTCLHCHNWQLSQSSPGDLRAYHLPPEAVVRLALEMGIPSISFTYNDPVVMYEYLLHTAALAREHGLRTIWHSNGSINLPPLKRLLVHTDAVTIDLKGFSDRAYANSDAALAPVLETLLVIRNSGVWLEVVYLIIPSVNDNPEEIRDMCRWIFENLGPDVPLHFSRFFPSYRLTHLSPTPLESLEEACRIAGEEGLRFVSIGNWPGHHRNSTLCPECGSVIIHRSHFHVHSISLTGGLCDHCGEAIPGVWE
jgi:pyruvate formate lyase activating enzyme